jgi:hypothetical protein
MISVANLFSKRIKYRVERVSDIRSRTDSPRAGYSVSDQYRGRRTCGQSSRKEGRTYAANAKGAATAAWFRRHWKQTDAWYYTLPGTKKRMALFDERGERIKGLAKKLAAEQALAKIKVGIADNGPGFTPEAEWIVARVCSDYIQYCERGVPKGTTTVGHLRSTKSWLNDLCAYCGALPVSQLKKGHITTWIKRTRLGAVRKPIGACCP